MSFSAKTISFQPTRARAQGSDYDFSQLLKQTSLEDETMTAFLSADQPRELAKRVSSRADDLALSTALYKVGSEYIIHSSASRDSGADTLKADAYYRVKKDNGKYKFRETQLTDIQKKSLGEALREVGL